MGNTVFKISGHFKDLLRHHFETSKSTYRRIADKEKTLREKPGTAQYKKDDKKTLVPVKQPFIPDEIIFEILSRLPVKSLLRLKCVCKQWHALIQDRLFIEAHISQVTRPLIVCNYVCRTTIPEKETFAIICGCDGLLLRRSNTLGKYNIRNPATHQKLDLPDPHKGSFGMALSFIQSTGDYKLVSVFDDKELTGNEGYEVLTVGGDDSWRPLKIPNLLNINTKRERISVVSAGGAVHCVRVIKVGSYIYEEVASLDLETECFSSTTLPLRSVMDWKKVWALNWNGHFALACVVGDNLNVLDVLVLEDYKEKKWGQRKIVLPLGFIKQIQDTLVPLVAPGGNLWFAFTDGKIIGYNIESGKITPTTLASRPVPNRYKTATKAFFCGPSLVCLKGMQPETERTQRNLQISTERTQRNLQISKRVLWITVVSWLFVLSW